MVNDSCIVEENTNIIMITIHYLKLLTVYMTSLLLHNLNEIFCIYNTTFHTNNFLFINGTFHIAFFFIKA